MQDIKKELAEKENYSFDDLCEIMRILRAPDGCPWDRAQTHESVRKNLIEETYEVVEAIDNHDDTLLCEELGDLLMQVVFHGVMSEEEGHFSLTDVTNGVCKKLVHRHPHVFGDDSFETPEQVKKKWDEIKVTEKARKTPESRLSAIPPCLPALMRAEKTWSCLGKYGITPEKGREADDFLSDEAALGDYLFSLVGQAVARGLDAENALRQALTRKNSDFLRQMHTAEAEKN